MCASNIKVSVCLYSFRTCLSHAPKAMRHKFESDILPFGKGLLHGPQIENLWNHFLDTVLNTAAEQSERNAEKDKNGENLDETAKAHKLEGKGATKVINVLRVKSFKSNGKSNIFRQSFGVKRMARQAGQMRAKGFNYTSKSVRQREVWPYPGPKASFHVMWKYKLSLCEERNFNFEKIIRRPN